MRSVRCLPYFLAAFLTMPILATAQASAPSEEAPRKVGDYTITQSLEFGYRYTDVEGAQYACPPGSTDRSAAGFCQNQAMYNTLVNLNTGPRLLEQTLALRAPAGHGGLFDHLFVNLFGFGGDPNQAARLRVGKQKAYDLKATYRRDQNFFDYNLLANPLNPGTLPDGGHFLTPGIGTGVFIMADSPHSFSTVRRMTDVDLIVAPQSAISLRLGYSGVRVEGPSGWTFHMPRGTEINPVNNWDNTTNLGRAGLDFRMIPKTTISLDFFYAHTSVGDNAVDQNVTMLNTAGQLADFGISWNVPAPNNIPCAASALFTPSCNQALFYMRRDQWSATTPTEQISLQSHVFKRVDLSGRFNYSYTHQAANYFHFWNGKTSQARQERLSSTVQGKRYSGAADFGATIYITKHVRVLETFRWFNWRIPLQGIVTTQDWLPGSSPTTVPVPVLPTTTTFSRFNRFEQQESKSNQAEVEWDMGHAAGAHIGYRYEKRISLRADEVGTILSPDFETPPSGDVEPGADNAQQPINTGLGGFWVRPNEKWRVSFDTEISSLGLRIGGPVTVIGVTVPDASGVPVLSSNVGTGTLNRITPRKSQQYRLRANYNPRPWAVISATGNYLNQSNDAVTVDYAYRNRNYGIAATLTPRRNSAFEIAYNYNLLRQSDFICFENAVANTATFLSGGTVTSATCPFDVVFNAAGVATGSVGLFQTVGNFHNTNQFFSALWRGKVLPRVTLTFGYSITNNAGDQLLTNPTLVVGNAQVLGTLSSSFHRPLAGLEVELVKNVTAKLGWNYYDYNEKGPAGPTIPRDFHSNSGLVSLKYAF